MLSPQAAVSGSNEPLPSSVTEESKLAMYGPPGVATGGTVFNEIQLVRREVTRKKRVDRRIQERAVASAGRDQRIGDQNRNCIGCQRRTGAANCYGQNGSRLDAGDTCHLHLAIVFGRWRRWRIPRTSNHQKRRGFRPLMSQHRSFPGAKVPPPSTVTKPPTEPVRRVLRRPSPRDRR